jgi:hypothetical protein
MAPLSFATETTLSSPCEVGFAEGGRTRRRRMGVKIRHSREGQGGRERNGWGVTKTGAEMHKGGRKEEGRRKKEEGRRKKEEGRRKKEEERRKKKEERRKKKEERGTKKEERKKGKKRRKKKELYVWSICCIALVLLERGGRSQNI